MNRERRVMNKIIYLLFLCMLCSLHPGNSRAQTPVSIELVLAVDTSLSVSNYEFQLQMKGIADALRTDEIMELISIQDGVAITVIQWAGWSIENDQIAWRLLDTPDSIKAYADEVEKMEREQVGYFTAIGSAIESSLLALESNSYVGKFQKIDISGDGISNAGPDPFSSRRKANQRGVIINGLAILTDTKDLDEYFRQDVITGQGAFVIEAVDYFDFARAIRLKLSRELAPVISSRKPSKTWIKPSNKHALKGQLCQPTS